MNSLKNWGREVLDGIERNQIYAPGTPDAARIAHIHSELSEVFEALRERKPGEPDYYISEKGKPEGVGAELADVFMLVTAFAALKGIDLEECAKVKHAYNLTRPPRHGKNQI